MKKYLLVHLMILCSCSITTIHLFAQTNISGLISSNTTWQISGSPYIVTGNILVAQGVNLTIDPGVTIKFDPGKALQVDGELVAIGNSANRILFTSNQTVPVPGDWGRIQFSDICTDAVLNSSGQYLYGSSMQYCDVKYGGGAGTAQLWLDGSTPYFEYCSFSESSSGGIKGDLTSVNINNCSITNSSGYGIELQGWLGASISNDSIVNNANGGLYINNSYFAPPIEITENYFYGNNTNGAIKIYSSDRTMNVSENYFVNNVATDYAIVMINDSWEKTVDCNHFIGNTASFQATSIINARIGNGHGEMRNNIFEDNVSPAGGSIALISFLGKTNSPAILDNNYFENNTADIICNAGLENGAQSLGEITHNTFINNNSAVADLKIRALHIGSYPDYLRFKFNNFSDPLTKIKLYNDIPFGTPGFFADSNYWNGTGTAYLDSVIYDYFDDPNKAVVYLSYASPNEIPIDSTCNYIFTGIEGVETFNNFKLFPNPVIDKLKIAFNSFIEIGTLDIFNLYGKLCLTRKIYQSLEITEDLSFLNSGVYIVSLSNGNTRMTQKLIIGY